jgi:membrane protein
MGKNLKTFGRAVKRVLRPVMPYLLPLKVAFYALWGHNVSRMAAAIAYFGAFSLAPMLVIMISLASLVFGKKASEGLVVDRLADVFGETTARFIQSMLAGIYQSSGLTVATVLAVLLLLWAATRIVGALRGSLNDIWGVQGYGGFGFLGFLVGKLVDLGMVILFGLLFLLAMLANTAISAMTGYFSDYVPIPNWLLDLIGIVFSLTVTTVLLSIIFRFLPNIRIRFRPILAGASVTAVLFAIGNFFIGRYLGRTSPGSAFGAAGSLAVIMIWMYYSAHIILFGAEVTRVYVERGRQSDLAEVAARWADAIEDGRGGEGGPDGEDRAGT